MPKEWTGPTSGIDPLSEDMADDDTFLVENVSIDEVEKVTRTALARFLALVRPSVNVANPAGATQALAFDPLNIKRMVTSQNLAITSPAATAGKAEMVEFQVEWGDAAHGVTFDTKDITTLVADHPTPATGLICYYAINNVGDGWRVHLLDAIVPAQQAPTNQTVTYTVQNTYGDAVWKTGSGTASATETTGYLIPTAGGWYTVFTFKPPSGQGIPAGATVQSARLRVGPYVATRTGSDQTRITGFKGGEVPIGDTPATNHTNLNAATEVSAAVQVVSTITAPQNGAFFDTDAQAADITQLLNEIISDPGYTAGQGLQIMFQQETYVGTASGGLDGPASIDQFGGANFVATLEITYEQ